MLVAKNISRFADRIRYCLLSSTHKKEHRLLSMLFFPLISDFLSSQVASNQVLSACTGLTAVFGMGTGGSPQLSPLNYIVQDSYPDNCIKMFFLTNSLLVSESSFPLCICFQFHSFLRFGVSDSLSFVRRLRLLQNWFSA